MLILGRFVLNSCWWYQPIRQNDVNHSNKIFEYIETHRDATTDASRFPKRGSHLVVELTRETRMFNCFHRFSGVRHNSSSPELHAWWKPTPCLKNRLPDKDKVPSIGIIYWITAGPLIFLVWYEEAKNLGPSVYDHSVPCCQKHVQSIVKRWERKKRRLKTKREMQKWISCFFTTSRPWLPRESPETRSYNEKWFSGCTVCRDGAQLLSCASATD